MIFPIQQRNLNLKRSWGIVSVVLFFCTSVAAQKNISIEDHAWIGFFNQTRIYKNWGTWLDVQMRLRDNFVQTPNQFLIRPGITYYFFNDLRLTLGYGFIHHYPVGERLISTPEHRPWQQLQWFVRKPQQFMLMNWLRLEQRFVKKMLNNSELGEGFHFNWRIRYNNLLAIPLTKKKFAPGDLQFIINDELMLNFGNKITFNIFDQNRFFLGFAYQLTPQAQIQVGYMNLFLQRAAGNAYLNQHTIRLFYFHNFDVRKAAQH